MIGRFCQDHGEQLERIAREFNSRKRNVKAVKKPPAEPGAPDALGRLPLEVRLKRVVDHVTKADGPVSREDAAKAAGLDGINGSLVRIIRLGREQGLLETVYGGLRPGPKAQDP